MARAINTMLMLTMVSVQPCGSSTAILSLPAVRRLKRKVVMFLCWYFLTFSVKGFECADYAEACIARLDNVFNIAFLRSLIRIAEEVIIFFFLCSCNFCLLCRVWLGLYLLAIKNAHGAVCTHDRNIG